MIGTATTDIQRSFETKLCVGELTITARDRDLLWAINKEGSIASAAKSLHRSYSHAQRRIVELEEETGSLVESQTGGRGGGGSTLTRTAWQLLDQFHRLKAIGAGMIDTEVTTLEGTITERVGQLSLVETTVGQLSARSSSAQDHVDVVIRGDTVVLTSPNKVQTTNEPTINNCIPGIVQTVTKSGSVVRVTVDIGAASSLIVPVTSQKTEQLSLRRGREVEASFKTTATYAIPRLERESRSYESS
jgi:molybdate transport system regulatory protein